MESPRASKRLKSKKDTPILFSHDLKHKTYAFIEQPTHETQANGSMIARWKGIEVAFESQEKGMGVRTTLPAPGNLTIPYGGADEYLTEAEFDTLSRSGRAQGNQLHYMALYTMEDALLYNERRRAFTKKEQTTVVLDAHPGKAAEVGYPEDCWIGARINCVDQGKEDEANCELCIVGQEYEEQRRYPNCKFYLFVKLLRPLPAGTFLKMDYSWGKNITTRRNGPAPTINTGKRKASKSPDNTSSSSKRLVSKVVRFYF